jgi:hypothetical protein
MLRPRDLAETPARLLAFWTFTDVALADGGQAQNGVLPDIRRPANHLQ